VQAPAETARGETPAPIDVPVTGRIVNGIDATPVPEARLFLSRGTAPFRPLAVDLDNEARFHFSLETQGSYRLTAETAGTFSRQGDETWVSFYVGPETIAIGPLRIELHAGSSFELTVRDAAGNKPIADAAVYPLARPDRRAETDSDGIAALILPVGLNTLRAEARGFIPREWSFRLGGASSSAELLLTPISDCRVTVSDPFGAALSGAEVCAIQDGLETCLLADGNGTVRFDRLERGSPFAVRAAFDGYGRRLVRGLHLDEHGKLHHRLVLFPRETTTADLTGKVVDRTGEPLPEVAVSLSDPDGGVIEETRTDSAGRFDIHTESLTAETHAGLFFHKDGYAARHIRVEPVDLVGAEPMRVVMGWGRDVVVAITDRDGEPLAGVEVTAHWSEQGAVLDSETQTTDTSGTADFHRVRGALRVTALTPGHYPVEVDVADASFVEIIMIAERHVLLRVLGEEMQPVEKVSLKLLSTPEPEGHEPWSLFHRGFTATDPGGLYEIQVGPEGDWVWLLEVEGYPIELIHTDTAEEGEISVQLSAKGRSLRLYCSWVPPEGGSVTVYLTGSAEPLDWLSLSRGEQPRRTAEKSVETLDAEGRLIMDGLPKGLFVQLVIDAPGRAWSWLSEIGDLEDFPARHRIPPGPRPGQNDLDAAVPLVPAGRITGAVDRGTYPEAAELELIAHAPYELAWAEPLDGDGFSIEKLPPGRYDLMLTDGRTSSKRVLDHRVIELTEGQDLSIELGAEPSPPTLLEVAGQPYPDGHLLVFPREGDNYYLTAVADESGMFRLPKLSGEGPFDLLFTGRRFPYTHEIDLLRRAHPNVFPHRPSSDRIASFQRLAEVRGRISREAVSWLLYLVGKTEAGVTYYRLSVPGTDGRFRFDEVPAGVYQLSRSETGMPPQTLIPSLEVGREDIDLGDITGEESGTLRIDMRGFPEPSCMLRVAVYSAGPGGVPEGQPLVERVFTPIPGEIVLEDIHAGDIAVSFDLGICPATTAEHVVNDTIFPHRVTSIRPPRMETTDLHILWREGEVDGIIVMKHKETGIVVRFTELEQIREPEHGEALMGPISGRAKGLPAGAWTVELELRGERRGFDIYLHEHYGTRMSLR